METYTEKKIGLIFPHQLFWPNPLLKEVSGILLIEDSLFFYDEHYPAKFHKQRLMLHRASMKKYTNRLTKNGISVYYFDFIRTPNLQAVFDLLVGAKNVTQLLIVDPVDYILKKRLSKLSKKHNYELIYLKSPNFFNTTKENESVFKHKKRYVMADFYPYQRKKLNILISDDGESPVGNKWSFDTENRKKLPKKMISELPHLPKVEEDSYVVEARSYIEEHFSSHYGNTHVFIYPTDHERAENWLQDFLTHRFELFGPYEDAIVPHQSFLYHGVLTPMMNIGLLTPEKVVSAALAHAEEHHISLPSLEGFIRQIIGWREFMRSSYEEFGVQMRTSNHWGHEYPIPQSFYHASTGIEPIDDVISRLLEHAYCHHIERLMILGGFMFLCQIHPRHVYRWFMEMFIDAYDWVMVPNVYAMSQHSAGGLITTKPYFSGSNYVKKMSHYKEGPWCDIWDGLYWKFIIDHSKSLAKNPRWSMMVSTANRMSEEKRTRHLKNAQAFLADIHKLTIV